MKKGFTLIEILLYVAFIGFVLVGVSAFFLFTLRSQAKTQAMRETTFEASRAMEIMVREIKQATGIYASTSIFDTNPGQLSLATAHMAPSGEPATYVDFFQCGTQLCIKREAQNLSAITSSAVQVQNLVFHLINSAGSVPSVQINLTVALKTAAQHQEYNSSVSMESTASLR